MTQHMHDAFGGEAPRQQDLRSAESASVKREESAGEERVDKPSESEASATSRASESTSGQRPRRSSNRSRKASNAAQSEPVEQAADTVRTLEAQGFTKDEARKLIYISDHLAQSAEAREAEATLRRLHFTRWLVEHGMLDEWSA